MKRSPNIEARKQRGAIAAFAPQILETDFGLWSASLRNGVLEYCYGFFGSRTDAAHVLAAAMNRLEQPR